MPLLPLVRAALSFGFCNILKAENIRNDTLRKIIPYLDDDFGYRGRALYSELCDQPPNPPQEPPFSGGQCEFCYQSTVRYTVSGSEFPSLNGSFTVVGSLWGPIRNLRFDPEVGEGRQRQWTLTVSDHGRCSSPRSDSPIDDQLNRGSLGEFGQVTLDEFSVVPESGGPDECGNEPPTLPPSDPNARQFPIDITINYDDGTDFTFAGNVFFGFAYFNTKFEVNIPLKFVLNNSINFTGNFNFNLGDVVINWGDGFDYPTQPPPEGDYDIDPDAPPPPPSNAPPPPDFDPPFPPNPDPDPDDPEDFDDEEPQEEPTIRRIVGVLVDTAVIPPTNTEIGQDLNPNVHAPDIGLVNFAYIVGGTRFYWGEDVRVKNARQVIFVSPGRYAVDVRGTVRQGGQWRLTPLYAQVKVGKEIGP